MNDGIHLFKKILTDPKHLNRGVYFWYNKIKKPNIST